MKRILNVVVIGILLTLISTSIVYGEVAYATKTNTNSESVVVKINDKKFYLIDKAELDKNEQQVNARRIKTVENSKIIPGNEVVVNIKNVEDIEIVDTNDYISNAEKVIKISKIFFVMLCFLVVMLLIVTIL